MELSTQQLVCTPNKQHCGGTGGCGGSTAELAYEYIAREGLTTEKEYPYQGTDQGCDESRKWKPAIKTDSFVRVAPNNLTAVLDALVNKGPLAILVSSDEWEYYETGIFDKCPHKKNVNLDHVVVLNGYGTDSKGRDYWIIRNSWAEDWGEKGYMKVKRDNTPRCGYDNTPLNGNACKGNNTREYVCGECGIIYDVSYPVGAKLADQEIDYEEI